MSYGAKYYRVDAVGSDHYDGLTIYFCVRGKKRELQQKASSFAARAGVLIRSCWHEREFTGYSIKFADGFNGRSEALILIFKEIETGLESLKRDGGPIASVKENERGFSLFVSGDLNPMRLSDMIVKAALNDRTGSALNRLMKLEILKEIERERRQKYEIRRRGFAWAHRNLAESFKAFPLPEMEISIDGKRDDLSKSQIRRQVTAKVR